jgi:hypothetical protein
MLVATIVIGLLAAIVTQTGSSRRGRTQTNRLLAGDAKVSHPPMSDVAPINPLRLDEEIFAAVGLRLETDRARAFAATLGQAAVGERTDDGGWSRRVVDRVVRQVPLEHLTGVTEDLGLGTLVLPPGDPDPEAEIALRALLVHVLRDPLQDVLRLAAGQRTFWVDQVPGDSRYQPAIQDAA